VDNSAWELLFKILVGGLGAMGAAILKTTWDEIRSLRAKQDELVASLPDTYARRDDVDAGFGRIERTLSRMDEKLDRLARRE
jgi:hypothetical protein